MVSAELMDRVNAGEQINLSNISLGARSTIALWHLVMHEPDPCFSDNETEDVIAQSKQKGKFLYRTSNSLEEQLKLMTTELSPFVMIELIFSIGVIFL